MTTITFAVSAGVVVLLLGNVPWGAVFAPLNLRDSGPDAAFVALTVAVAVLSAATIVCCRSLRHVTTARALKPAAEMQG